MAPRAEGGTAVRRSADSHRALRNTFVLDKLLLPSKVDGDRRWGIIVESEVSRERVARGAELTLLSYAKPWQLHRSICVCLASSDSKCGLSP